MNCHQIRIWDVLISILTYLGLPYVHARITIGFFFSGRPDIILFFPAGYFLFFRYIALRGLLRLRRDRSVVLYCLFSGLLFFFPAGFIIFFFRHVVFFPASGFCPAGALAPSASSLSGFILFFVPAYCFFRPAGFIFIFFRHIVFFPASGFCPAGALAPSASLNHRSIIDHR